MMRLRLFSTASLLLVFATLAAHQWAEVPDVDWNSAEQKTALFGINRGSTGGSTVIVSGDRTLAKWQGLQKASSVDSDPSPKPRRFTGVIVSLIALQNPVNPVQMPVPVYQSVMNGIAIGANCSTSAGNANANPCSTQGKNAVGQTQYCSTSNAQGFCSTNPGGNAPSTTCSASGQIFGGPGFNTAYSCSVTAGSGANSSCSIQSATNPGAAVACSSALQAGDSNTSCSSGTVAGAPNTLQSFCSAVNGAQPPAGGASGMCSVQVDSPGSNCSTSGNAGSTCSVQGANGAGNTNFMCSVTSQGVNGSGNCTAGGAANANGAVCSAAAGAGICSVYNPATGRWSPPAPNGGAVGLCFSSQSP